MAHEFDAEVVQRNRVEDGTVSDARQSFAVIVGSRPRQCRNIHRPVHIHQAVRLSGFHDRIDALERFPNGKHGVRAHKSAVRLDVSAAVEAIQAILRIGRGIQVHPVNVILVHQPGDAVHQQVLHHAVVADAVHELLRLSRVAVYSAHGKVGNRACGDHLVLEDGPFRRLLGELKSEVKNNLDAALVRFLHEPPQVLLMSDRADVGHYVCPVKEQEGAHAPFGQVLQRRATLDLFCQKLVIPAVPGTACNPIIPTGFLDGLHRRRLESEGVVEASRPGPFFPARPDLLFRLQACRGVNEMEAHNHPVAFMRDLGGFVGVRVEPVPCGLPKAAQSERLVTHPQDRHHVSDGPAVFGQHARPAVPRIGEPATETVGIGEQVFCMFRREGNLQRHLLQIDGLFGLHMPIYSHHSVIFYFGLRR